jgi:hypothetical protein
MASSAMKLRRAMEMPPAPNAVADDDKEKTYSSDEDGLKKAARDLAESRASEPELVERKYQYYGERQGEAVEGNKTVTADRAASDLKAPIELGSSLLPRGRWQSVRIQ